MNFYFAPMEGLTGYIYRNAHRMFFGDSMTKYFAPFINANLSDSFKSRELNDILPENNKDIYLVPQIMTNRAKDFLHTANKLKQLGYDEINLNLGCPSKTVVSKGRGSGFLARQKELEEFLDEVFEQDSIHISIKTRIGKDSPSEFEQLLELFNRYPLKELIIHPRIQTDFYKNKPNKEVFAEAVKNSENLVCYNGDINTVFEYEEFIESFPSVSTIMIGRGLLKNPALINEINHQSILEKRQLRQFHDKVLSDYESVMYGDKNVLFKMKELWFYMGPLFTNYEKYLKKIKKSQRVNEYKMAVVSLFEEQELVS